MNFIIVLIIVLIICSLFTNKTERFRPSNVFAVDNEPLNIKQQQFPFESDKIDIDTSLFLEQNKYTFDLRDTIIKLVQREIDKRTKSNDLKVFNDSLEKIFMDTNSKNLIANVTVYDSKNFFAHKLKVHVISDQKLDQICNNCTVKIQELKNDVDTSFKINPNEGVLTPTYYRILNTLHTLDPFKTSSNVVI